MCDVQFVAASPTTLPKELIDAFFDVFRRDKKALKACRLVCRDWLSSGGSLFTTIKLYSSHIPSVRNMCTFRELIQSPHCTIGASTRKLKIQFEAIEEESGEADDLDDAVHYSQAEAEGDSVEGDHPSEGLCNCAFEALAYLDEHSHIKSLEISSYIPYSIRPFVVNNFQHVEVLEMRFIQFNTFGEVSEIICSFPNLTELVLLPRWEEHGEVVSTGQLPRLNCLRVTVYHPDTILTWLLSFSSVPRIRTLEVDLQYAMQTAMPSMSKLLRVLGPDLKHFALNIPEDEFADADAVDAFCCHIDLSPCTELTSIRLNMRHDYRYISERQPFNTIPPILSRIRSTCLEQVVLCLSTHSGEDLELPVWSQMEDALIQPQFSNLRELGFYWEVEDLAGGDEGEELAKARVKEMFSKWKTRGIPQITGFD